MLAEVSQNAKIACEISEQGISDHFADVSKMVSIGSGANHLLQVIHLSRYAKKPFHAAIDGLFFPCRERRQRDTMLTFRKVSRLVVPLDGASPLVGHIRTQGW